MPEGSMRQANDLPGVLWKNWDSPQGAGHSWCQTFEANRKGFGRGEFFQRIFLIKVKSWAIVGE